MIFCTRCGAQLDPTANFCSGCGVRTELRERAPLLVEGSITAPKTQSAGGRGYGQLFGIDPRIALLTLIIDTMLFGVEGVTFGASVIFLSIPAGIALASITYRAQMKWYGDDRDSAFIKACILGLLTAIPTEIPALLYVPSGLLGLAHNILSKKQTSIPAVRQ